MENFYIIFVLYLVNIVGGNFFVRKICKLLNLPDREKTGLMKAGKYIGYFERFIITTFFLLDSLEAIAFIFTGKSILRLSKKEESEYYLIGTLASFSWAILFCFLFRHLIKI